eukprot:430716-Amorphochlora_amoeboformis.AAC.2
MVCESSCRVIGPLRSRCLGIRVPSPDEKQVFHLYLPSAICISTISQPKPIRNLITVAHRGSSATMCGDVDKVGLVGLRLPCCVVAAIIVAVAVAATHGLAYPKNENPR